MKLIIISGLSGSGKTVALHTLEDEGFYCVDNFPLGLLNDFTDHINNQQIQIYQEVAVGIDARSGANDLKRFNQIIKAIKNKKIEVEVIYFQAEINELIKRFSDTRRRHPLTRKGIPLAEAIDIERNLLLPISQDADLCLDTTHTNVHQLRAIVKDRVVSRKNQELSILFQSFGFKHNTPTDSDFVFDVRCLPNPHWEPALRQLTGQDPEVQEFFRSQDDVADMFNHIRNFMEYWIPKFAEQSRYYLTVSIGCTGGQHRSVYITEQLNHYFRDKFTNVSLRHREME
ncbi:MAG: RNase adapter RapZ [endosymbiont of Galathealinum brachiosum]|uniref:RNase adapter RapZ n=1 Tax=endosymbiont of Galathealinum brachiosum TaxID=2200906 RepID=A0A370DAH9_9GAMM|nr:MAG: RNase adapter RapZ [endosymbiont of Galathealinum brachiosum]